jgi:hypothetical protein
MFANRTAPAIARIARASGEIVTRLPSARVHGLGVRRDFASVIMKAYLNGFPRASDAGRSPARPPEPVTIATPIGG